MNLNAETLYNLLPAIYRIRDAEQGEPLKALISVIAEQAMVLEEDLAQLYDDQFIETCADWVVPYIGDLIGHRTLHSNIPTISSPRAFVANTIGYRRRKGTATVLEQLARDVTGWNARVVEFFQILATTQYMNHLRPGNLATPALRRWKPLERLNTAFDSVAHTADVRRIASQRGRYNIPNIGIFLWRLNPYSLTKSPAYRLDDRRYLFSPLGNNTPLFNHPETEDEITQLAQPINVPMAISRRVLADYFNNYYGESLLIDTVDGDAIATTQIKVCNLSDLKDAGGNVIGWANMPSDKIAIDPELGRIALPEPKSEVVVTYHYGFSDDLGGGEYERDASLNLQLEPVQSVSASDSIQSALDLVVVGGVVEITDSKRYTETLSINVEAGQTLELRAANEHRPTLVLNSDLLIRAGEGSEVTLNGLLISGASLQVTQPSDALIRWTLNLRHCTLVPGLTLSIDGLPEQPNSPTFIINPANTIIELKLDHCIVGGLRVAENSEVKITNSIVDATAAEQVAYSAPDGFAPGGSLHIENSTIIGKVHTTLIEASNTIFLSRLAQTEESWVAPVIAQRRQQGCVRFSYLPLNSQVPRRYRCQPEMESDALRVRPQFTSLRYGAPGYAQLSQRCALEIRTGADDESEMGAFHDLYQPQRETNLRVCLDEYLRFGLEAGIFYAT
jgi:hypothetical protein